MERFVPSWETETIYRGFSDRAFQEALERSGAAFAALREELRENPCPEAEALASLLARYDRAALEFSTPETFHAMRSAVRLPDPESAAVAVRLEGLRRLRQSVVTGLEGALTALPEEDLTEEALGRTGLSPWAFLLTETRRLAHHQPASEARAMMAVMQENGSRAWAALRNELDAAASVTVELPTGRRILPLAEARGLQTSPDPEVRRLAYEAELASYPAWEIPMAACLNGVKGEALAELPWKHYDSLRSEMLDVNKMTVATLEALHAAVEDHLPALRAYLRAKGRLLGHRKGLPWYDLPAPLGETGKIWSYDEAHDLLAEILGRFSKPLGELTHRAFADRWIDALPAPGKGSGGICYDLPELREIRILVNFDGSLRALRSIAHELGHAFHSRCLDGTPFLLRDVPTPLCETAALFNETLVSQALLAGEGPRLALLDAELAETVQTVMDVYSRYLFEDALLALRPKRRLRPQELCELMLEAQRTVFGDGLDGERLHPYMWMCKVHYYIPEFHYYNYPYYFGLLFSRGLCALYRENEAGFPDRYRSLLAGSGQATVEETARAVGADLTDRAFWDKALSGIDRMCEEFCALC